MQIREFEQLAKNTQSSDIKVRKEAENFFSQLQQNTESLALCRQVLEESQESIAQFQCSILLREVITSPPITAEIRKEWLQYLLAFASQRVDGMQPFVRSTILQTIAIISKLGSNNPETIEQVFNVISEWTNNSIVSKSFLGLSLLNSMLIEFQGINASALGLSIDFHLNCQTTFQKQYLVNSFQLVLQCIHSNNQNLDIIRIAIACAENILSWEFINTASLMRKQTDAISEKVPLRLPAEWRPVVSSPAVVELFFNLAIQYFQDPTVSSKLQTCIGQLAGISGPVFDNQQIQFQFISNFVEHFQNYIALVQSSIDKDMDVDLADKIFAVGEIGKKILKTDIAMLHQVPKIIATLNALGSLTVKTFQLTINDDFDLYLEPSENLLMMWSFLLEPYQSEELDRSIGQTEFGQLLMVISLEIVKIYIETKLHVSEQEADDSNLMKDVEVFEDQLINVAMLARINPAPILEKLCSFLQELQQQLVGILNNPIQQNHSIALNIQEQIHWAVLIAGHVLADSGFGEIPQICSKFMILADQISTESNPLFQLPNIIFNILGSLNFPSNSAQHQFCSPLLVESLFWFVDRWSCSYLFPDESRFGNFSSALRNAYSGDNGMIAVDFILKQINHNFSVWGNDAEIVNQLIMVLQGLSKNNSVLEAMLHSEIFSQTVQYLLGNVSFFPVNSHNAIVQTISGIATRSADASLRQQYLKTLCDTVENTFNTVIQNPSFMQEYQTATLLNGVIVSLEMFGGLALSVDEITTVQIFEACGRHFGEFVKLLGLYHSYPDVQVYILQIFRDLITNQNFDELQLPHQKLLFETIHSLIETFSKNEIGRHRVKETAEQDELHEDISILLEILAGLISSEYEGFERETVLARVQKARFEIDLSKVVFVGVNSLLPLISQDLLQYPRLCLDYMHLIGLVVEYFPDKLSSLPPDLLRNLIQSLLFGTQKTLGRIPDYSYQAIQSLGLFYWAQSITSNTFLTIGPSDGQYLAEAMDILLTQILNGLVLNPLDSNILRTAADCVFAISLGRPQTLRNLFESMASGPKGHLIHNSLSELMNVIGEQHEKQAQKLASGQIQIGWGSPGLERYPSLNKYRNLFTSFIIESRSFLLVK